MSMFAFPCCAMLDALIQVANQPEGALLGMVWFPSQTQDRCLAEFGVAQLGLAKAWRSIPSIFAKELVLGADAAAHVHAVIRGPKMKRLGRSAIFCLLLRLAAGEASTISWMSLPATCKQLSMSKKRQR